MSEDVLTAAKKIVIEREDAKRKEREEQGRDELRDEMYERINSLQLKIDKIMNALNIK